MFYLPASDIYSMTIYVSLHYTTLFFPTTHSVHIYGHWRKRAGKQDVIGYSLNPIPSYLTLLSMIIVVPWQWKNCVGGCAGCDQASVTELQSPLIVGCSYGWVWWLTETVKCLFYYTKESALGTHDLALVNRKMMWFSGHSIADVRNCAYIATRWYVRRFALSLRLTTAAWQNRILLK